VSPTKKDDGFLGLGSLTRGQLLSICVFLSGGGLGYSQLHDHSENVETRVQSLEVQLAVIQSQGAQTQKSMDELTREVRDLTRFADRGEFGAAPAAHPPRT
jgi:hypothetical protein